MRIAIGSWIVLFGVLAAHAEEPKKPRYETRKLHDPDGIGKFYVGREIAHVMGHQGAGGSNDPSARRKKTPQNC